MIFQKSHYQALIIVKVIIFQYYGFNILLKPFIIINYLKEKLNLKK